jgi:hypothetical protein
MDKYSVLFAGNDLSLIQGVDLYNHDFNTLPQRDIKINKIARRNKSIITSSEYTQKSIPVYMEVCSGSRANTEDTLTLIKSFLQEQNKQLIGSQGGTAVEYTATMNEFNVAWEGTKALVTIIFLASDPIGRESASQTFISKLGLTTASYSESGTIEGSATAYPTTTITVNSITGGTTKQVTVSNAGTNQGITIERTWTAGDILIIDSENMDVTVNGVAANFTGMLPQWAAGSATLSYLDNFTTRNVDIVSTYNPMIV